MFTSRTEAVPGPDAGHGSILRQPWGRAGTHTHHVHFENRGNPRTPRHPWGEPGPTHPIQCNTYSGLGRWDLPVNPGDLPGPHQGPPGDSLGTPRGRGDPRGPLGTPRVIPTRVPRDAHRVLGSLQRVLGGAGERFGPPTRPRGYGCSPRSVPEGILERQTYFPN